MGAACTSRERPFPPVGPRAHSVPLALAPHTESVGNGDHDPTRRTMTFSPMYMRRRLCAGLRTLLAALGALVVVVGAVASVALAAAPPASAANWAPVHAGDFPDPSILQWNYVYYGFATQNFAAPSQTINIQVSTSLNGVSWNQ